MALLPLKSSTHLKRHAIEVQVISFTTRIQPCYRSEVPRSGLNNRDSYGFIHVPVGIRYMQPFLYDNLNSMIWLAHACIEVARVTSPLVDRAMKTSKSLNPQARSQQNSNGGQSHGTLCYSIRLIAMEWWFIEGIDNDVPHLYDPFPICQDGEGTTEGWA